MSFTVSAAARARSCRPRPRVCPTRVQFAARKQVPATCAVSTKVSTSHGWYPYRWVYGQLLPPLFWSRNYWIEDYWNYGLEDPPYGFVWVRDGNDALLIDVGGGQILSVVYGVFY